MDALPVDGEDDVPFKSTVRTTGTARSVGVMHACGHDAHTAILMGVAEVLAGMREQIAGTVKFIFQPAEETPPHRRGRRRADDDRGRRARRIPTSDAIFGLHVTSMLPTGKIGYRSGPLMASADDFRIFVRGTQTHGAMPWRGVDPIVVASQIVHRAADDRRRAGRTSRTSPRSSPSASSTGGVRHNIIPDEVEAREARSAPSTRRSATTSTSHVKRIAEMIARLGARRLRGLHIHRWYDVTVNDPASSPRRCADARARRRRRARHPIDKVCGAEDFSFYQKVVPGFFFFVGCTPPAQDTKTAPPNHTPRFFVDEAGLPLGARALAQLAVDWLEAHGR